MNAGFMIVGRFESKNNNLDCSAKYSDIGGFLRKLPDENQGPVTHASGSLLRWISNRPMTARSLYFIERGERKRNAVVSFAKELHKRLISALATQSEKTLLGDLLHHFQRIGDAAGPEGAPDAVDLALDFTGDHAVLTLDKSG